MCLVWHIRTAGRLREPKELYVVPDAIHIDLYDRLDKIPFDKLENFFKEAFEK